ncbi:hypothetical protein NDU88_004610 [Pleurodeles waltl]|uniref:Uncharacterized protein n=1 Tax=Pleurodeles waltl TaxID=8319 RepID=A0AAV7M8U7_PLEWA|nr:hypothetical protein NDU88_004610 [Pleurodeles waltl]
MPPKCPPRPPPHLLRHSRPALTLHPGSSPERWVTTGSRSGTRQQVSVPIGSGPLPFAWRLPSAWTGSASSPPGSGLAHRLLARQHLRSGRVLPGFLGCTWSAGKCTVLA